MLSFRYSDLSGWCANFAVIGGQPQSRILDAGY
jgi:hypothetical protein